MKNRSQRKASKKRSLDKSLRYSKQHLLPRAIFSIHFSFLFFVCCTNFNTVKQKPYACNLAIQSSSNKQSNAFDKSFKFQKCTKGASDASLIYRCHFSSIAKIQYWVLYPFLNLHWYFESCGYINFEIFWDRHSSKFFDIFDNILTGL